MVHGRSPAQRTPTVMRPHRRAPLGMKGSSVVQAASPRGNAGATVISTLPGKPADCCCKKASAALRIASASCWPASGTGCATAAGRRFCCATAGATWRIDGVRAMVAGGVGIGAGVGAATAVVTTGLPFAPNCGGSPREARLSKPPDADAGALAATPLGALATTTARRRFAARH